MKFRTLKQLPIVLCSMVISLSAQTTVYDSAPNPLPPNVVSQGFQCCSVSEFGDQIQLAPSTPRNAGFAKVVMSSWVKHSEYPLLPDAGFTHPISLNIYASVTAAQNHTPLASVVQTALLPWRPEPDPTCFGGNWRSAADNQCYGGLAFVLTFDLRTAGPGGSVLVLPETFIFGVEFNTNTWGYAPLEVGGPFQSLNVGMNTSGPPTIGTDVESDAVYINFSRARSYTDRGAGGVGTFRRNTAWMGHVPAVQFTTFGFPANGDDCKKDGWRTLFRANFTSFKNQSDCVSYTQSGK